MIGACIRMATFFQTAIFVDNTWASVQLMTWTCVEPGMYLIAACLVKLRPVLSKLPFGSLGPTTKGVYGSKGSTKGGGRAGFVELQNRNGTSGQSTNRIWREDKIEVDTESMKDGLGREVAAYAV